MTETFGVSLLAAGMGTRLKLSVPKPLAPLLGRKLIDFPIISVGDFFKINKIKGQIGVVVGHQRELVQEHLQANFSLPMSFAWQKEQRGTAHALQCYFDECPWAKDMDYTLVACADTPLITHLELGELFKKLKEAKAEGIAASFVANNPYGYGRILRSPNGFRIIEEKEASEQERAICEVNAGLYILKTSYILKHLKEIGSNNSASEFYLTDLFRPGQKVLAHCFSDEKKFLGINDLHQLSEATRLLQQKKIQELTDLGVRIMAPEGQCIDWDVKIGRGTIIYPHNVILGKTSIGENCVLYPGSVIENSSLEVSVQIKPYCHIEKSQIGPESSVGPFAHLRPETILSRACKVGNFVETKKSTLGPEVKISHLSYVGDAEIGENSNIGCGFITCNYDGRSKHKTTIGKNCFIGSDSQAIAPVNIGNDCFVASSTTITEDMPDGSFAISRGKQLTKEGMAKKFLKF